VQVLAGCPKIFIANKYHAAVKGESCPRLARAARSTKTSASGAASCGAARDGPCPDQIFSKRRIQEPVMTSPAQSMAEFDAHL